MYSQDSISSSDNCSSSIPLLYPSLLLILTITNLHNNLLIPLRTIYTHVNDIRLTKIQKEVRSPSFFTRDKPVDIDIDIASITITKGEIRNFPTLL